MKNPKNEQQHTPKRTLASLKEDYNNFQIAGGNIRNARKQNNVIHKNLLMFHLSKYVYHLSVTYNKSFRIFYSKNKWAE